MFKKILMFLKVFNHIDSSGSLDDKVEKDPMESLRVNSIAKDWTEFYMPDIFQKWAIDLKRAVALKDANIWRITGKSIIILSDSQEVAVDLIACIANEANMSFFKVPANFVSDLTPNSRAKFQQFAPSLVMLEAGDWMAVSNEPHSFSPFGDECSTFSKNFSIDLSSFDLEHPVVFVTAVKSDRSVCSELKKVDAFDRIFSVEKPTPEFLGNSFLRSVTPCIFDESTLNSPKKIGLLLQAEFETIELQKLLALRLQRLSQNESRNISFNDIASLALRGIPEHSHKNQMTFENSSRRKTALHEAGHACIAIIASGGSNVPDYATVVPSKNFEGVVFESLSYYDKMEDFTYNNMLLKTRVFLAGRAAEDIFYGSANVSSGANSDLAAATQMCFSLFAYSGFNSDMATAESSAHNLAVLNSRDVDPVQYDRISREVRSFLQEQYKYVLTTLEENRPFVESVADRLLWDPVVDQSEMIELATRFGLNAHPE